MSPFEYAMVLISIIVGLGVTHILSGLGAAVHRLRGHGPPIHLEITYLTWVAFIFFQLVFFWWWEFKWSELAPELGIGLFLFLVLYAVVLFSLVVILVPHQLSVVDDSWDYFLSIRSWFYGGLLIMNAVDLADTLMKGVEWDTRFSYLSFWTAVTVAGVVGLTTTRRSVHTAFAITLLVWNFATSFYDLTTLGDW